MDFLCNKTVTLIEALADLVLHKAQVVVAIRSLCEPYSDCAGEMDVIWARPLPTESCVAIRVDPDSERPTLDGAACWSAGGPTYSLS